jgi:hypothetical protein
LRVFGGGLEEVYYWRVEAEGFELEVLSCLFLRERGLLDERDKWDI